MADNDPADGAPPPRPPRGSGSVTVHLADELEVYFSEVAHGRPVGFVASAKWRPRADVYETDDTLVVQVELAGMRREAMAVELQEGVLVVSGERRPRREGKVHYHAMEMQVGPFERRLRLPAPVDPGSMRATYEGGILEIRLTKIPERRSGNFSVPVR